MGGVRGSHDQTHPWARCTRWSRTLFLVLLLLPLHGSAAAAVPRARGLFLREDTVHSVEIGCHGPQNQVQTFLGRKDGHGAELFIGSTCDWTMRSRPRPPYVTLFLSTMG